MLKAAGLNRGKGIHVFSDLNKLEELLNQYYVGFIENELQTKTERAPNEIFIKWSAFVI